MSRKKNKRRGKKVCKGVLVLETRREEEGFHRLEQKGKSQDLNSKRFQGFRFGPGQKTGEIREKNSPLTEGKKGGVFWLHNF